MPAHDWSKVIPGIFHDFHQRWSLNISDALNEKLLPKEMYALVEQYGYQGNRERVSPDVITLKRSNWDSGNDEGGLLLKAPPRKETASAELKYYLKKKNVVAIRHASDDAQRCESALRAEIARLNLGKSVRLIGPAENVAPLLWASDALVSVSEWEGLSLAHLDKAISDPSDAARRSARAPSVADRGYSARRSSRLAPVADHSGTACCPSATTLEVPCAAYSGGAAASAIQLGLRAGSYGGEEESLPRRASR